MRQVGHFRNMFLVWQAVEITQFLLFFFIFSAEANSSRKWKDSRKYLSKKAEDVLFCLFFQKSVLPVVHNCPQNLTVWKREALSVLFDQKAPCQIFSSSYTVIFLEVAIPFCMNKRKCLYLISATQLPARVMVRTHTWNLGNSIIWLFTWY